MAVTTTVEVMEGGYTLEVAARRMGMTVEGVKAMTKRPNNPLPRVGTDPVRVDAQRVEQERAERLKAFELVADLTVSPDGDVAGEARQLIAEELLRDVLASQQLVFEGTRLIQQAVANLGDAVLRSVPMRGSPNK